MLRMWYYLRCCSMYVIYIQGFALQLLCTFAGVYRERHGGRFFEGLFSKALAFLTLARAS